MTTAFDEAALRHWLVDYLVTNIGCSSDGIECGRLTSSLKLPVSRWRWWGLAAVYTVWVGWG